MHYYQHHIGDFIKDTANLSDHQLATYMRMLWAYYDTEKPIFGELEDIAFAMRSDEKTVRLLLRHYFKECSEGWSHSRCDREIAEYRTKSESAKKGAKARWTNAKASPANTDGNADAVRTHTTGSAGATLPDANQEPITNNQEPDGEKPVAVAPHLADLPPELLKDFLVVRKAKKAGALTPTALKGIEREGKKAGLTLVETITACCEFGWQGFNAQWYADRNAPKAVSKFPDKNATPPVSSIWHESAAGIDAKAQELSLEPIGPLESRPAFKARVMAAARESVPA